MNQIHHVSFLSMLQIAQKGLTVIHFYSQVNLVSNENKIFQNSLSKKEDGLGDGRASGKLLGKQTYS